MKSNASVLRNLWNRLLLSQRVNVCSEDLNGCGMLELKVLKLIHQDPRRKIRDILDALGIPNSTLTNAINRLTSKGLLLRKLNNDDLRSFALELTEKGESSVLRHLEAEDALFENMLSCLDDQEKETFISLFGRITDHIEKD